ncbi:hypothetical protein M8J75_000940 [Diaphorina citri]|nr:hypothetical protein M8J75_000940 [Diaphorina citri]
MDGRPLYPVPPPPGGPGSSLVSYVPHPQPRPNRPVKVHKRSQSTREPYYERRRMDDERKLREEIRRRKSIAQYAKDSRGAIVHRSDSRPSCRADSRPSCRADSRPKAPAARCKEYTVSEEDIEKTYTGLDREIAEEFICAVMEPNSRHQEHSDDDRSSYQ